MYLNTNNLCIFEGRISSDVKFETVNANNNSFNKIAFSIAIDKGLNAEQKRLAKEKEESTVYFVPIVALGQEADFINNNFSKGSAIKVICGFKEFKYTKDGEVKRGYNFEVVKAGFTVASSNQNNNNNNNNNYNNNNSNNNSNKNQNNNNSFTGVGDSW